MAEKSIDDVANGVWLFIKESWRRTQRLANAEAVAEYYDHLISDRVAIHRETLEKDVGRFVQLCIENEPYKLKAYRESYHLGLQKENVRQARVLCANEPGCE